MFVVELGKRVDLKAVSDTIQIGGVETRCSPTKKVNMSIHQGNIFRIEMVQEENVYAVFIPESTLIRATFEFIIFFNASFYFKGLSLPK